MGKTTKRGKRDTNSIDSVDTLTADNQIKTQSPSLEDELQRAETALRNNQFKMNSIHKHWKTYLQRLSYMVLLISIHQLRSPTTACLKDAKQFNQALQARMEAVSNTTDVEEDYTYISGYQVFMLVIVDSMVHLLGIAMAACLSFYLVQQQPDENPNLSPAQQEAERRKKKPLLFADLRYMLSNACLPPILTLYFTQRQKTITANPNVVVSCLEPQLLEWAKVVPAERQRSLPVVLIFHAIVTACMWFMDRQQKQATENLQKVDQLRVELQQAQKGETKSKKKI